MDMGFEKWSDCEKRTTESSSKAVRDALRLLLTRESALLESDVAERAICAKLAKYLEPHFPKLSVDVEYNRHGLQPKIVGLPENCRGGGKRRIFPDVIVHQRGNDDANLLVIQVKKETNREPRDCDRAIIFAMKREYRYTCGLLIELPAGPGAAGREPKLEWL